MHGLLAIHHRAGSFSDRWIESCRAQQIPHKVVDCHDSNIFSQLDSAHALLWHHTHLSAADALLAKHLIRSVERMGLLVFPSTPTCWHFDDKIAQKYLFESVSAPLVPTHVFYDKSAALRWIDQTTFPKVFKLRRGAGSQNVQLARNAAQARRLTLRMFGRGFSSCPRVSGDARHKLRAYRGARDYLALLMRLPRKAWNAHARRKEWPREKGYAYFQDFMPGNTKDTRVTIIGERAFAYTRGVRPHDFRASGSGRINYDLAAIDVRCIELAFKIAERVGSQSLAFDFVHDFEGQPWMVEVCFGYVAVLVHDCPGHWDRSLNWHAGHIWPQDAILEDLLATVEQREQTGPAAVA